MDYGKYRYEQSKREREARKKQKIVEIKEVRLTPKIENHDFQVKVKSALKFLSGGDKVKASVKFRGREIVHAEDRKSTRLNSSHVRISYAVFCLKKKIKRVLYPMR